MSSYNKLAKSSIIYAVGNIGSKLIFILLVPIYTYCLSASQYGTVDLITTTLSLLLPVFTFSIFDAVLRFSMDGSFDKKEILTNGLTISIIGFILAILLYPLFLVAFPFGHYLVYLYVLLLLQSINNTFLQFARAMGYLKLFAASGLVSAIVVFIFNVLFLIIFNWGIKGYLLSLILSVIISSLLLLIGGKLYLYMSLPLFNPKLVKQMSYYSIPLIPNAVMWWVMGASDRYIITYFIGIGANGIYAVATKLPGILNIVNSIFIQAWQVSAIEESNSKDKSKFQSNIFNLYSILMFTFTSFLLVFLKLILKYFVSAEYFEAWRYVPFLFMGVVFSGFSSFLGANYIASKNTKGVFKTSIVGAIINFAANMLLVPLIGINGAAIATMMSFIIMSILRMNDTKNFVKISIHLKGFLGTTMIIFLQIAILYMSLKFEYIFQSLLFLTILFINHRDIKIVVEKMIGVARKRLSGSANLVEKKR